MNESERTLDDDGRTLLVDSRRIAGIMKKLHDEIVLRIRRDWTTKIREEFGRRHDQLDGGERGACCAIRAANFVDPGKES